MDSNLNDIFDGLSSINLEPMQNDNPNDRVASVQTAEMNEAKKSGGVIFGQNGIQMPNGLYVNIEELSAAVEKTLSKEKTDREQKRKKVVKREKSTEEFDYDSFKESIKTGSKLIISNLDKIKNQDARLIATQEKNSEDQKKSGGLFLGNNGINLPNGEYVSKEEVTLAFIKFAGPVLTSPVTPSKIPTIPGRRKVVKRSKLITIIPFIIAGLVAFGIGINSIVDALNKDNVIIDDITPSYVHEQVISKPSPEPLPVVSNVPITIDIQDEEPDLSKEDFIEEKRSPAIGDIVYLKEGTTYNIASDRTDINGTVGNTIRQEDYYTVDAFSFISPTGQIIKAVYTPGLKMEDVKAELEAQGIEIGSVQIHYDLGLGLNRDRPTGWIKYDEETYKSIENIALGIEFSQEIEEIGRGR
jgi:hypothetical protein